MSVGKNTISGKLLAAFIERIERLREEKKSIGEMEKLVFAELVAGGYAAKRVREILRIRTMKPHDREEAEAELDMYLHTVGMAKEAPLFRAVGQMGVDLAVREQVIDAFKLLVPSGGEIIVKVGGAPVRLWRDEKGEAQAEDWKEPEKKSGGRGAGGGEESPVPPRRKPAAEVPEVDGDGAAELGRAAYGANQPITANPFPFGDKRRPRWDEAWREASGSDGMGEA